jgi:hypothetical protein
MRFRKVYILPDGAITSHPLNTCPFILVKLSVVVRILLTSRNQILQIIVCFEREEKIRFIHII